MKKKYLHFLIFFVLMAFSTDIAFLLPALARERVVGITMYETAKVVGIMLAIIIGYLKLGSFDD